MAVYAPSLFLFPIMGGRGCRWRLHRKEAPRFVPTAGRIKLARSVPFRTERDKGGRRGRGVLVTEGLAVRGFLPVPR